MILSGALLIFGGFSARAARCALPPGRRSVHGGVSLSGGPLHAAMRCPAAVFLRGGSGLRARAREKRGQTNTGRSLKNWLLPVLFLVCGLPVCGAGRKTGAGPGRIAAGQARVRVARREIYVRGRRRRVGRQAPAHRDGGVVSADRCPPVGTVASYQAAGARLPGRWRRVSRQVPSAGAVALRQSIRCPSTETVTTCHGMNLPLARSAAFAAASSPPQHGTSMRMTVRLATSLSRRISVSFSV